MQQLIENVNDALHRELKLLILDNPGLVFLDICVLKVGQMLGMIGILSLVFVLHKTPVRLTIHVI